MSLSPAQIQHQQKIQAAKRELEENDGKTIKAGKVQEWALLEIAEMLQAIHYQLMLTNIPKPGRESGYPPSSR